MRFADRREAGKKLAAAIQSLHPVDPVVLALPRGGVPVADEVARALAAPLDVVLVRKIGAPQQPELAIGAVVDGNEPDIVLNDRLVAQLNVPEQYIEEQKRLEIAEIERRRGVYLGDRAPTPVAGRTAIVIDDGVATGATVRAALRAVRQRRPARLILAVPVAAAPAIRTLRGEVDDTLCLSTPSRFFAIGQFYDDFRQLEDDEVRTILEHAATRSGNPATESPSAEEA
jgi:putative phosphoribosyl transferase